MPIAKKKSRKAISKRKKVNLSERKELTQIYLDLDKLIQNLSIIRDHVTKQPARNGKQKTLKTSSAAVQKLVKDEYDDVLYMNLVWKLSIFQSQLGKVINKHDLYI